MTTRKEKESTMKRKNSVVQLNHSQDQMIKFRPVTEVVFKKLLSDNITLPDERKEYVWEAVEEGRIFGEGYVFCKLCILYVSVKALTVDAS